MTQTISEVVSFQITLVFDVTLSNGQTGHTHTHRLTQTDVEGRLVEKFETPS